MPEDAEVSDAELLGADDFVAGDAAHIKEYTNKLKFKIFIQLKKIFSLNQGPVNLGRAALPFSKEIHRDRVRAKRRQI